MICCSVGATLALLLAGCASSNTPQPAFRDIPPASSPQTENAVAAESAPPAAAGAPATAAAPELLVTPDNSLEGRVVSVNDAGRFVVLKFPVGRIPAMDSTLYVHRQGAKVGELKVTGPQKDDHIVADIRTGDCRVADVVRDR